MSVAQQCRYQVFISSTFSDLIDERRVAYDAVLSLKHLPVGMEHFPASSVLPWALIQDAIDDSDYYVLIVGGRYGSINEAGISYTESEFDYAVKAGKPILAFVHDSPESLPRNKTDASDHAWNLLISFRAKVLNHSTCSLWSTADDLKARILVSLMSEILRSPGQGWVRRLEQNHLTTPVLELGDLNSVRAIGDVVERSIMDRISGRRPINDRIASGLVELDDITGGLLPGSLAIFASRPSMGLSSALVNIILGITAQNLPALVFTTQTSADIYTQRMISCEADVAFTALELGVSETQLTALSAALSGLSERSIYFDDHQTHTLATFAERCRSQKRLTGKLALVVIDSLEFIQFSNAGEAGLFIKRLAVELEAVIIVATNLRREVDLRPNKRPMISDLSYCGDIVDLAEIVIFLYRPDLHSVPLFKSGGNIELIVAQNREGPLAVIRKSCNFSTGSFGPAERSELGRSDDC